MAYQTVWLALLASVFLFSQNSMSSDSLVIALKPDKNPEKMAEERVRLESILGSLMKQKVEVIVPLSSAVITQGFANGTIDVGYLSSVDMVVARNQKAAEVLLAGRIKGKTSYESLWLIKKENGSKDISELEGKPVSFASRTSTSGYLIPFWDLIQRGKIQKGQNPETFFGKGNVLFGTGYVSAVEKVLSGQAQAAAVSDYVFFGNKHLSKEQKSQLRVLQKQGPVPTHSIAVRSTLPEEKKRAIKKALMILGSDHKQLRDQVFTSELVEVQAGQHLATTIDALDKTRLVLKK